MCVCREHRHVVRDGAGTPAVQDRAARYGVQCMGIDFCINRILVRQPACAHVLGVFCLSTHCYARTGEAGVGKSSLVHRFVRGFFKEFYEATIGGV